MSDSAFKSAAFPGFTTQELKEILVKAASSNNVEIDKPLVIINEIERRAKRDAGDVSVMTAGERLRHARKNA